MMIDTHAVVHLGHKQPSDMIRNGCERSAARPIPQLGEGGANLEGAMQQNTAYHLQGSEAKHKQRYREASPGAEKPHIFHLKSQFPSSRYCSCMIFCGTDFTSVGILVHNLDPAITEATSAAPEFKASRHSPVTSSHLLHQYLARHPSWVVGFALAAGGLANLSLRLIDEDLFPSAKRRLHKLVVSGFLLDIEDQDTANMRAIHLDAEVKARQLGLMVCRPEEKTSKF